MPSKSTSVLFAAVCFSGVAAILTLGAIPGCGDGRHVRPPQAPPTLSSTVPAGIVGKVDAELREAWKGAKLAPASEASDATFLRRVTLDLTGVVPTTEEARAFLKDPAADKRTRLVDRLLSSPRYVQHWTNYWDELLMGLPTARGMGRQIDRMAFRRWLYGQIAEDRSYAEWVQSLLTANGQNSPGGRLNEAHWDLDHAEALTRSEDVNGAVNFLLRYRQKPQNLSGQVANRFLGLQIQCAECHDHPTDKWTQEQFKQFTAAFMHSGARRMDRMRGRGVRRMEVVDLDVSKRRHRRQVARQVKKTGYSDDNPATLDGQPLQDDLSRRAALANWMTAPSNPWFARTVVNRMWATMLGRGFVHPVDGFAQNPTDGEVVMPQLLEMLTKNFVDEGMSIRKLLRVICLSEAYARSAEGGDGGDKSYALWSRFRPRAMNANQLLDSLVEVGQIRPLVEDLVGDRFARIKVKLRQKFIFAFSGEDDDSENDTFTGTVPQALMLLNGVVTGGASAALRGSALGTVRSAGGTAEEKISSLYRLALSRNATSDELTYWKQYLAEQPKGVKSGRERLQERRQQAKRQGALGRLYRKKQFRDFSPSDEGYEDLLWVLLNSNEFFFIH